ncbi:hypothetical protein VPHD479_0213 [Vibrio phage D479]
MIQLAQERALENAIKLAEPLGLRVTKHQVVQGTEWRFSNFKTDDPYEAFIYVKGYIAAKAGK